MEFYSSFAEKLEVQQIQHGGILYTCINVLPIKRIVFINLKDCLMKMERTEEKRKERR